jgi:integrase
MENGRHTNDPTKDIGEVPTPDLAPQGISDAAIDALLRAAASEPDPVQRQRDQVALALLVYAGLRIQETCHLQLRDLDLEGGMITIRRGKGERHGVFLCIQMPKKCCNATLMIFGVSTVCPPLAAVRNVSHY